MFLADTDPTALLQYIYDRTTREMLAPKIESEIDRSVEVDCPLTAWRSIAEGKPLLRHGAAALQDECAVTAAGARGDQRGHRKM